MSVELTYTCIVSLAHSETSYICVKCALQLRRTGVVSVSRRVVRDLKRGVVVIGSQVSQMSTQRVVSENSLEVRRV